MQQETKNTSFLSNTNVTQNENSSLLQPLPRELNPQIEGKSMTQYVRKFLMKGKVKNPEQILKEKVEGKQIILDNPIRGLLSQRQLHAPSRRATISAKTRRDLQLFSPSHLHFTTLQSYEAYEPLHQLWKDYMTDLLTNANETDIKNKLLKADYHGALFRVVRSRNPTLIGTEGIVLMETQQLFVLITPQNTLKKIPKADSEFNFVLPPRLFTLHGMHFLYRTSERAARKFKAKSSTEMK